MELKKDLYWFEHRLAVVAEAVRRRLENPGLRLLHDGRHVWLRGEVLDGREVTWVEKSYTENRRLFMWAASTGWLDVTEEGWDLSSAGRAEYYAAYPDMPMLLEIRAAMYEAARNGTLPAGPPEGL
jgi:hypothetical protein